MKEKGFWEGVQAAVPTALGYISIGLACGIIGSPYVTPVGNGLDEPLCLCWERPVCHVGTDCGPSGLWSAIAMTVFFDQLATLFAEPACIDLFPSY